MINEYDARLYCARYKRELERRIHNDLATGRLSQWTRPVRPQKQVARRAWPIVPYAGPGGIGLFGRF